METSGDSSLPPPGPAQPVPLALIFRTFVIVGLLSFGGGLSAWIRREAVVRRHWMDDRDFLTGYALSQIVPGPTSPNVAVFIGARLRGLPGALTAIGALMVMPVCALFIAAQIYFRTGSLGLNWMVVLFTGMGAAAIGMTLSTGIELGRRNLDSMIDYAIVLATILSIDLLHVSLLKTLAIILPFSLAFNWQSRSRRPVL